MDNRKVAQQLISLARAVNAQQPADLRRSIAAALATLGLHNKFTIKTVGFSDLARGSARFIIIQDWKPDPIAAKVKEVLKPYGIAQFKGPGIISSASAEGPDKRLAPLLLRLAEAVLDAKPDIKVGDPVQIKNVQHPPQFNGKTGKVTKIKETNVGHGKQPKIIYMMTVELDDPLEVGGIVYQRLNLSAGDLVKL